MKKSWYFESLNLYPDITLGYKIKRKLFSKKSPWQKIEVCQTEIFGKILFLDGITQTTEKDEFIYHEMIVHIPLLCHPRPRKVCIIGGGDGGALREVLRHPVKEVHLVEIDEEVIKVSRRFFPTINQGAFQNSRAKIHIADGIKFIKNSPNEFDVLIIDSSDPIGPAKGLFSLKFYQDAFQALKKDGIFVAQSGSSFLQAKELKNNFQNVKKVFPFSRVYFADVPTYYGGAYGFVLGSKKLDAPPALLRKAKRAGKTCFEFEQIKKKYQRLKLKTKYYNPQIHFASFILPNYVKKYLKLK